MTWTDIDLLMKQSFTKTKVKKNNSENNRFFDCFVLFSSLEKFFLCIFFYVCIIKFSQPPVKQHDGNFSNVNSLS